MSGVCGISGGKGMRVAPPGCDEQTSDDGTLSVTDIRYRVHVTCTNLLTVVLGHDGGTEMRDF